MVDYFISGNWINFYWTLQFIYTANLIQFILGMKQLYLELNYNIPGDWIISYVITRIENKNPPPSRVKSSGGNSVGIQ